MKRVTGLLIFAACLVLPELVVAVETAQEYWPEVDIWVPLSWQMNVTYQFDPHSSASNLVALNTILHVYF